MSRRTKTLIATLIIVFLWLPLYTLVCWQLLLHVLPYTPLSARVLFYPVAGMFWIVPIGLALPWMYREPTPR